MQVGVEAIEPQALKQRPYLRRNRFSDGEGRTGPIAYDQCNAGSGASQDLSGNGAGRSTANDADVEAAVADAPGHRAQWT